jgi:hypothetical protein
MIASSIICHRNLSTTKIVGWEPEGSNLAVFMGSSSKLTGGHYYVSRVKITDSFVLLIFTGTKFSFYIEFTVNVKYHFDDFLVSVIEPS